MLGLAVFFIWFGISVALSVAAMSETKRLAHGKRATVFLPGDTQPTHLEV